MTEPDWRTSTAGTMIRSALWLIQEVGEGNEFTKQQLRDAFPTTSQIDRRVRDLRSYGWVILTNVEDAHLTTEEQRFVRRGVPVWDPKARREADRAKPISATDRQAALERDDFLCTVCGIGASETYIDDSNTTAVLTVARRETVMADGEARQLLATECKRCHTGAKGRAAKVPDVLARIKALAPTEQQALARWIENGRREVTDTERAWSAFRRLPAGAQHDLRDSLDL